MRQTAQSRGRGTTPAILPQLSKTMESRSFVTDMCHGRPQLVLTAEHPAWPLPMRVGALQGETRARLDRPSCHRHVHGGTVETAER